MKGKINLIQSIIIIILIIVSFCVGTYLYERNMSMVSNSITCEPIIYLYPEKAMNVSISVGNPELLTCSYPNYDEKVGWNVIAELNGNLVYRKYEFVCVILGR